MAQVAVNFRMDGEVKKEMEQACKEMGLTLTSAFNMFAAKVAREKRIPFDVTADPFYSEENMKHLRNAVKALNEGKGIEHNLLGE